MEVSNITVYPDKRDIESIGFLSMAFVCTTLLFFYEFNSWIYPCLFLLIFCILAIRYWVAFGRTISFDANGILISLLGYKRRLTWNQIRRIILFDSKNSIGYKDVATIGIEFLSSSKDRPKILSPSSYCFFFSPWSYVFLSFAESVVQPKGVKYPVHYQVEKESVIAFLESNNILIEGLLN